MIYKRVLALITVILLAVAIFLLKKKGKNQTFQGKIKTELKSGDLIFQTSRSSQSQAIQLATNSKYSHCGIVYKRGDEFYVFEAVEPVKLTLLNEWIAKGKNNKFVIRRLRNADQILTKDVLLEMEKVGREFAGKNYDLAFEWSDEKIYCSELIWKVYKRAAKIEIGKLQRLSDFNLSNELVKQKMNQRYGNHIPLNETVISPRAIFDSELLFTVDSN